MLPGVSHSRGKLPLALRQLVHYKISLAPMNYSALRTLALAAILLLPGLASAHPGHSVLDPMAAARHAGHEVELGSIVITAALSVALLAGASWLRLRRR